MTRLVVLDTETTGLEAKEGHRIIEVGAIEVVGRRITERRFHHYVNPERDSDEGALAVHGLTRHFLEDKPKFAEIADDLIAFVKEAEVVIHNAAFDLEFLDAELARLGRPPFAQHCLKVTDSLQLAREQHPGKRNSLDALCERYQVSNAHRTLHGALLDAGLLAEVYLAMTRGQDSLTIDVLADEGLLASYGPVDPSELVVLTASAEEVAAHEAVLAGIEKESKAVPVWRAVPAATPA
ncbi:MAG TPA: DNA polymerase III subunit epsilon [Burkholderiaceae bacterium]|nr:DNA polymerase III subunit epsilon [Burkholderiaceae bacterium]HQR75973.1 DNA polymerase III subunit epsilon [Burkholderiaceae bacterium]